MSRDVGFIASREAVQQPSTEKNEEPVFVIGDVINGYRLVQKIDEGGFGQVFKVTKDDKTFYAMKLESNSQEGGSAIKLEINVLNQLPRNSVFPAMISGGKKTKFHYLILELLGENLKMLKAKSPNQNVLTEATWSRLGIQCLYALKVMHDTGFVHRDVKPSNFAVRLKDPHRIIVFDFGLARKFILKADSSVNAKKHKASSSSPKKLAKGKSKTSITLDSFTDKNKKTRNSQCGSAKSVFQQVQTAPVNYKFRIARPHTDFRGTHQYASPNAHALIELGRHDDVWSLLYMIAEMFLELPWSTTDDIPLEELKQQLTLLRIFTDDKNTGRFTKEQEQKLRDIEKMLRSCNYYDCPDYEMVHGFFLDVFTSSKTSWSSNYDWEKNEKKKQDEGSKIIRKPPNEKKKKTSKSPRLRSMIEKQSENEEHPWENPDFFKGDKWSYLKKPTLCEKPTVSEKPHAREKRLLPDKTPLPEKTVPLEKTLNPEKTVPLEKTIIPEKTVPIEKTLYVKKPSLPGKGLEAKSKFKKKSYEHAYKKGEGSVNDISQADSIMSSRKSKMNYLNSKKKYGKK